METILSTFKLNTDLSGTHGILLLSSNLNGMDVKLNNSDPGGTTLEYLFYHDMYESWL